MRQSDKPKEGAPSTSLSPMQPHSPKASPVLSPAQQLSKGLGADWTRFAQGRSDAVKNELTAMKRGDGPALSKPMAQYMLGRSLVGEKIETHQANRLMSADATVTETRGLLSKGRGNVSKDIDASGGESTWRTQAGRTMATAMKSIVSPEVQQQNPGMLSAIAAMKVRAGNCGEHGMVATLADSQRLETEGRHSESVHMARSSTTDHGWSERRDLDGRRRPTDMVMDAWGVGPAIERQDSAFGHHVTDMWHYSTTQMPTVDFRKQVGKIPEHVVESGVEKFTALKDADYRTSSVWSPTHVMSDSFRQRAQTAATEIGTRAKLEKATPDLMASYPELEQRKAIARQMPGRQALLSDIHKVGVVRTLGGSLSKAKESL